MPGNGAEYEVEDGLDAEGLLQVLSFGMLLAASVVGVAVGVRDGDNAIAFWCAVLGLAAAFGLARVWFGGMPVVES